MSKTLGLIAVFATQAALGALFSHASTLGQPLVRFLCSVLKLAISLTLLPLSGEKMSQVFKKLSGIQNQTTVLTVALFHVVVNELFQFHLQASGSKFVYLIYGMKPLVLPLIGFLMFDRRLSPLQIAGALFLFCGIFVSYDERFQDAQQSKAIGLVFTLVMSCLSTWSTDTVAKRASSVHGLNMVVAGFELVLSLPYLALNAYMDPNAVNTVLDYKMGGHIVLSALLSLLQTIAYQKGNANSVYVTQCASIATILLLSPGFGVELSAHVALSSIAVLFGSLLYFLSAAETNQSKKQEYELIETKKPRGSIVDVKFTYWAMILIYLVLPITNMHLSNKQAVAVYEDSLPFIPFFEASQGKTNIKEFADKLPSLFEQTKHAYQPLKGAEVALVTYYAPQKNRSFHIWVGDDLYTEQVNSAMKIMAAYATYHSMPFFFRHRFMVDTETGSAYWGKMDVIEKYLRAGYKWVIWTDVDVVFMTNESLIDVWIDKAERGGYDVALLGECIKESPEKHGTVRSGFFAIKSSEKGLQFLDHWRNESANTDFDQFPLEDMALQSPWKDMAYIGNPDGIHTYPQCFERYDNKALSVHFAGGENKQKVPSYASKSWFAQFEDLEIVTPK
ncbi:hypothetical protein EDD86DRAFT_214223 [Gorgonomyces haynaldii]|nr:hypothetical protein EDD86DRAFT_214223 [Gorgonomyces haynaldii]